MSSGNNRNRRQRGGYGGAAASEQSRPNYAKSSVTTDMISKKQAQPSSRRDSDSTEDAKKSPAGQGASPQNQLLTTSSFYKSSPPMQTSSVKRSPTQSKRSARKASAGGASIKQQNSAKKVPPKGSYDSVEVVSSKETKESQPKDSDATMKSGRDVSFGDKEQFPGKNKTQQSKLKVDKKIESKPKSPRGQKGVNARSEKVVESPRHQIKNSKEVPVSKVISDKQDGSKSSKIEYKKQEVVHNTIKDKVQLYRQTVESKEDSIKSDKKEKSSIGKQSSPLVISKSPTKKHDQNPEKKDTVKKIEIEKEPKVGQKRKYDQIKNIAQEIEKKQKDVKMIEAKKDEKLIVENQVKTEDEQSKKRQKTKEVESVVDLVTPSKKHDDIQMENLKDSNVSISTDVENEEAQKMISAPQNSQNASQNGGVGGGAPLTQDDRTNVQITADCSGPKKLSQDEITALIKKYEQWRHLQVQDKQLDQLITNREEYDEPLLSHLRQNQRSMLELNSIINQTQDEVQLHTKWCLNFQILNGSIYERQEAIKYSLENYYRRIGQF